MTEAEWTKKYYGGLIGYTCNAVSTTLDEGDIWPVLHFSKPGAEPINIEISRDQEGNGPGFMFGLPVPEPTT